MLPFLLAILYLFYMLAAHGATQYYNNAAFVLRFTLTAIAIAFYMRIMAT